VSQAKKNADHGRIPLRKKRTALDKSRENKISKKQREEDRWFRRGRSSYKIKLLRGKVGKGGESGYKGWVALYATTWERRHIVILTSEGRRLSHNKCRGKNEKQQYPHEHRKTYRRPDSENAQLDLESRLLGKLSC